VSSGARPGRVVIVGGGIAGLAAAYFLRDQVGSVTVLEGSPQLGGKLATSEVAGLAVDSGAEALLARRPEAVDLIAELGLADRLVDQGATTARIWTRGEFRPLPRRQFMGVPGDFDELERTRIVSSAGVARAREDVSRPATPRDGDVAVAEFVGARLGAEVVDRLVEPLLGGVYAGRPDQLSYEATLPALAQASLSRRSLVDAVNALLGPAQRQRDSAPPPVFTTLAAGLGTLPETVARASGACVRTKATVRELARTAHGWRLTIGPTISPEYADADAVILALPARPAGRLVGQVDTAQAGTAQAGTAQPGTAHIAADLAAIEYASMAIVTLAYPVSAFGQPLTGSGYLVPAVDGRPVKAATFSTVKWPHLLAGQPAPGSVHIVRCSVGRIGEEAVLQRDDADLIKLAAADFAAATGVAGDPVDARVTRWGGGLPQYTVGHIGRVARIRAGVAALGGLAVCGAAYDGIGVPACIASARLAAEEIAAYLTARRAAITANTGEWKP
jgi:protoporphyrinogen/coproporphyrinogen III oxidase